MCSGSLPNINFLSSKQKFECNHNQFEPEPPSKHRRGKSSYTKLSSIHNTIAINMRVSMKKVLKILTTGWIVEFPGKGRDGLSPPDFFEQEYRPRKQTWV